MEAQADNERYQLEVTANQLTVIENALEDYCRLRMNQWFQIADDLSEIGMQLNACGKYVGSKMMEAENRRNDALPLFEKAYKTACPHSNFLKTDAMMIAEDMLSVFRYVVSRPYNIFCRKPFQTGTDPLPNVEVVKC